jgi:hypothetical protein
VRPPTSEEIQQRALEVHFERGGTHGFEVDDWLEAWRELLDERFEPQQELARTLGSVSLCSGKMPRECFMRSV